MPNSRQWSCEIAFTCCALAIWAFGCSSSSESTCTGTVGHLKGTVTNNLRVPLAQALLAIEAGGIYLSNPDPSKGNPSYQYSTVTDANGMFDITLPCNKVGIHAYLDGYRYGAALSEVGKSTTVTAEAFLPQDKAPNISSPSISPALAAPGAAVSVDATVAASDPRDPLSEEVLLFEPVHSFAKALDPPSPGVQGKGFPDGRWRTFFPAPDEPGSYTYFLVATSENCLASNRVPLTLTVR
jgi:hypothetical protein